MKWYERPKYKPKFNEVKQKDGRIRKQFYCGSCNSWLARVYQGEYFCRKCGGKIDWGNEE